MKAARLLGTVCLMLCLGSACADADDAQEKSGTREIRFEREMWLKITPPCVLESGGSTEEERKVWVDKGRFQLRILLVTCHTLRFVSGTHEMMTL